MAKCHKHARLLRPVPLWWSKVSLCEKLIEQPLGMSHILFFFFWRGKNSLIFL